MKGLSLCGGGSKGSYELGALEALRELDIEFEVVTGTSIGSLNGAMYVQGELSRCEELWNKISITSVITNGFEIDVVSLKGIVTHQDFKPFFKDYVKGFTTDITPFKKLLKEYIKPKLIKESKVKFGIITSTFPIIRKVSIDINETPEDKIIDYLLASSSAFPIFPLCKIDGKQYIDGGYTDNLPINYAFELGAKTVIAIDLRMIPHHKEYVNHPSVDYIYPKWDLGSFLYFNPETISRNRKLGYYDTMKYYGKYCGFRYTFSKTKKYDDIAIELSNEISRDFSIFSDKKTKNLFKREGYVNIFSILNEHINRSVEKNDYFIKCLEMIAFYFDIPPTKVYSLKSMMSLIIQNIVKIDSSDMAIDFSKLKNDSKKREYILECNKQTLITYMYTFEVDDKFKFLLLQTIPELYLCYSYIKYVIEK